MYRRPIPPGPTPAPTDPSPPPALGRSPLPLGTEATGAITRFIVQVAIVATLAVIFARLAGNVWPNGTRLVLALGGLALLGLSGIKWLWGNRNIPVFTAGALFFGVVLILLPVGAPESVWSIYGWIFAIFLVLIGVSAGSWADRITGRLDAKTSLSLAVGFFVLLVVSAVPDTAGVRRFLLSLGLVINLLFVLAVAETYVGYVLANPGHPVASVSEAARRWRRIRLCLDPATLSPHISAVVLVVIAGILTLTVATPQTVNLAEGARATDAFKDFLVTTGVVFAVVLAPIPLWLWSDGRALWRAFVTWMLYEVDESDPPGIYRPYSLLSSRFHRQLMLGAVVAFNILLVRFMAGPADFLLVYPSAGAQWAAGLPPEGAWVPTAGLLLYVASFIAPVVFPFVVFLFLASRAVRVIHDQIEETPPAKLYDYEGV